MPLPSRSPGSGVPEPTGIRALAALLGATRAHVLLRIAALQADRAQYRLAAQKLRTRADLLDWTAHLMEKDWLPLTDWRDLIGEACEGGKRIAVVTP